EPYVIEDLVIDGSSSADGIKIENTNASLVIRNCTIEDNIIDLYNCKNVNISNNYGGISLHYSDNNTVSGNDCSNNFYGIKLTFSSNNTILGNNCSNNLGNGIELMDYSSNNTISGNIFSDNDYGIYLINSSNNNQFYLNSLFNNNKNAFEVYGSGNQWDNGSIGNYWDDYSGVDIDNDGIGDAPYNISGDGGGQDHFPIWDEGPMIEIASPAQDNSFGSTPPTFLIIVNDSQLDTMWYSINQGPRHIFSFNGTINQAVWNSVPDGTVNLTFYANDSLGNINSESITIIKDTTFGGDGGNGDFDPLLSALVALPIIFGVLGGASGLFVLQRYLGKSKLQAERKEMKGKLKLQLKTAKSLMELKHVIIQADIYGLREIGDSARKKLRPILREKLESSTTEGQIKTILNDVEKCRLPGIVDAANRKLRTSQTRAIKSTVLDLGTKFARLQVVEIAEQTNADLELIIETIKEMIENEEIYAQYFKSSRSVAFNQQANINEIDSLMDSFQDWEKEGKGKRE
ncbi:MAG: hypothetical protein EU547_01680, partial [Promethearchaeota archaeon]